MFRRRKIVKQMSAEELKSKLFEHFDKTGSLNRMRTELRGKLMSDLFKITVPLENSVEEDATSEFDKALLPLQVCNWLVYDHLQRLGYQYALSTFVSEANLSHPEQLLTANDILSLFGLENNTPDYKTISKMYLIKDKHQHLHSLLLAVIKCLFDSSYKGNGNQNVKELSQEDLAEKVSIDVNDRSFHTDFRKDNKGESFSLHEMSLNEQLKFVREERDKEVQVMRERLLKEVDHLHEQERRLNLDVEQERIEIKKKHDLVSKETEKLKEKEMLLAKEYENKLERKVRELESDFISKVHAKEKEIEECKQKLHEKNQKLSQLESDVSNQHLRSDEVRKEFEEMKNLYKSVQEKYSCLLDENTNLLKKFESLSDYAVLKGDLEIRSSQVTNLQQELEHTSKHSEKERNALVEKMRNLESKLKSKETELFEAQKQLHLTRDTLHMEETVWNKERRKLEQETLASRDTYKTLYQRLEEQKDDIQALHQTIHILHYQLTDKDRKTATKNEIFIPTQTIPKTLDLPRNNTGIFRVDRRFTNSPTKYNESSLKFIQEAKDRISRLQKEADTLQDKCAFIYSSTPEFHCVLSPLKVSSTSSRTHVDIPSLDRPEVINNHFENLIRNEIPTLDLSLPTHIKTRIANTITDIFVPHTLDVSAYPSNVDNGIVNACEKNPIHSDLGIQEKSKVDFNKVLYDESGIKHSQVPSNSKEFEVSLSTRDSIIKSKETCIDKSNLILTDHKNATKSSEMEHKKSQQQETNQPVSTPEVLISGFVKSTNISERTGLLQSPTRKVKILESVSKLELLPSIEKESEKQEIENGTSTMSKATDPIVVDLDATWKRKLSVIPTVAPQSLFGTETRTREDSLGSFKAVDLDAAWKQKSSQEANSLFGIQTQHATDLKDVERDGSNLVFQDTAYKPELQSGSRNVSDKLERQKQLKSNTQGSNVISNLDEPKSSTEKTGLNAHQSNIDVKKLHDDSLSELSEIHLSCGSEQEQQKDDSDNW